MLKEEYTRVRPDRNQFAQILEGSLPSQVATQMKQMLIENTRCDSAQFVKDFRRRQREKSAGSIRLGYKIRILNVL